MELVKKTPKTPLVIVKHFETPQAQTIVLHNQIFSKLFRFNQKLLSLKKICLYSQSNLLS